jgi:hypothetical protein
MGQSWSSTVSLQLSDQRIFEGFRGPLRYYCYLSTVYPEDEDAKIVVVLKSLLDDSCPAVQVEISLHKQKEEPFICVKDGVWKPLYPDLIVTTNHSWTYLSILDGVLDFSQSVEVNRSHITPKSCQTLFHLLHTKLVMGPRNVEIKKMEPTLDNTRSLVESYKFSLVNE